MPVPLNEHITVIAGCTDTSIARLISRLRPEKHPLVIASQPAQLEGRTKGDSVLYYYLEDTHGDDSAQVHLLRRTMEMWPTIICARSSVADFKQALERGDSNALYMLGTCGIRMDLFLRLVNYVVDAAD